MRTTFATFGLTALAAAQVPESYPGSFPPTSAAAPATSAPATAGGDVLTLSYGPASSVAPSDSSAMSAMSSPAVSGSASVDPILTSVSVPAMMNGTTTTIPCSAAACTDTAATDAPVAPVTTKSACPPKNGTAPAATAPATDAPTGSGPAATPSGGDDAPVYTGAAIKASVSGLLVIGGLMLCV